MSAVWIRSQCNFKTSLSVEGRSQMLSNHSIRHVCWPCYYLFVILVLELILYRLPIFNAVVIEQLYQIINLCWIFFFLSELNILAEGPKTFSDRIHRRIAQQLFVVIRCLRVEVQTRWCSFFLADCRCACEQKCWPPAINRSVPPPILNPRLCC